ncbi:MAG: Mrp/NBP35 family ATP-binding protein [candidate division NC10 bacterium]|nr:Mrp/NBP35 family ATP-binding protein [candidate division NC10 bacterium]
MITEEAVLNALRKVNDPELHRDLVSLGMVKEIKVDGGAVAVTVELTTPACPMREQVEEETKAAIKTLPGVGEVTVNLTASVRKPPAGREPIPGVKHILAVGSGKGGVGKSTVTVNLAVALAEAGASVGLLDSDIYGPSIPIMMGVHRQPEVVGKRMIPPVSHGVKLMSLGFLLPDDTSPVVWRGPMVGKAVSQMLMEVDWGELDYILADLPPGTGDASLTLAQAIPLSGAVIVMTPQEVAVQIATKTLNMFRTLKVPILGIIENMSYLLCPHCEQSVELFGHGGGRKASQRLEVPFLGEIPLDPELRRGGDVGRPILIEKPDSPVAAIFRRVAGNLAGRVSVEALIG